MIVWGLLLSVMGAALAEFKKNGGLIPLNKNLWWVAYCAFVLYVHIRMLPWSIELHLFKLCVMVWCQMEVGAASAFGRYEVQKKSSSIVQCY